VAVEALETPRLLLEPWRASHGGMLARLAALPDVMRFVGPGATWTAPEAEERSQRALAHWAVHGFGWRAVRERASGGLIGLMALDRTGDDRPPLAAGEHEIGWWIDPAAWGRGFAVEGGLAIRDEAFDRVGAPSVVARVHPANAPSLAVAARLGLTREYDGEGAAGVPVAVLRLRHDG
jgi:RimJ/RimL family protein N-acetyltransferase